MVITRHSIGSLSSGGGESRNEEPSEVKVTCPRLWIRIQGTNAKLEALRFQRKNVKVSPIS